MRQCEVSKWICERVGPDIFVVVPLVGGIKTQPISPGKERFVICFWSKVVRR